MEKADIKNRVDTIRKNSKGGNGMENPNDKECPFRDQVCNSRCKLFRANKPGFECPFQELNSMSYNLMMLARKLIGLK